MTIRKIDFAMAFAGVTAICAVVGVLCWCADRFDWLDRKRPALAAAPPIIIDDGKGHATKTYIPNGNGLPTVVAFQNQNEQDALIQSIDFQILDKRKTGIREVRAGAGPTIPVTLGKQYNPKKQTFSSVLPRPLSAPGNGQWTTLEVGIVEPAWVGTTYIGKLTVYFANGKPLLIDDVELDVLKAWPRENK